MAVALMAVAVAASASAGVKDAPPPEGRSYVLIGVAPPDAEISLSVGEVREGVFQAPILSFLDRQDLPVDGFVLIDAKADRDMAIVKIGVGRGWFGASDEFVICRGSKTIVFHTTAGKVVYLTNVQYDRRNGGLMPRFRVDLDSARAFMAAHYPALAASLEQGQYQFLTTGFTCGSYN